MIKSPYIYVYNNDFLSFLSLIQYLFKNKFIPSNIKSITYNPSLFEEVLNLEIPVDDNVIKNIIEATSINIFNTIYKAFLSDEDNKEIIIFYFLLQALKHKDKVFYMRNLKGVGTLLRISGYVSHEIHKLEGFIRFKELKGGVFYATIEPDNNILYFLSKHFKKRLSEEFWIIEDKLRKLLSVYDKKDFYIVSSKNFSFLEKELSENEGDIQDLWKSFYRTIAIKERTNERCRMNFMPKKYWKYIIEMSDEIEESS